MTAVLKAIAVTLLMFARPANAEEFKFAIDATGLLKPHGGSPWRAEVDVGLLPLGSHGKLELTIVNTTDRDFYYDGLLCNFPGVQATVPKGILLAAESITFSIMLDTPKTARRINQDFYFNLCPTNQPLKGIMVVVRYELAGVIAFAEKIHTAYAPSGPSAFNFRVPVVASADTILHECRIESTNGLTALTAKLLEDENGCYADCIMARKDLTETETTGELKLFNPKSGYTDTAACFIITKPPIDVLPTVTRFVVAEDRAFKATCLVRVEPTAYPAYREKIQAASIGCKAENGDVIVECRQIAPFLFRVYLTFKSSSAKPEKPTELYWSLSAGAETAFTKTQVFFGNEVVARDK